VDRAGGAIISTEISNRLVAPEAIRAVPEAALVPKICSQTIRLAVRRIPFNPGVNACEALVFKISTGIRNTENGACHYISGTD
jgi:hypothetical protein